MALNILVQFGTTYLCKAEFLALTIMRPKSQPILKISEDTYPYHATSSIQPKLNSIWKNGQAHSSYQFANLLSSLINGTIICIPKNNFKSIFYTLSVTDLYTYFIHLYTQGHEKIPIAKRAHK